MPICTTRYIYDGEKNENCSNERNASKYWLAAKGNQ